MPLGLKTEGYYPTLMNFYYKNKVVARFTDWTYGEWRGEYKDQEETGIRDLDEFIVHKLKQNGNRRYILPGVKL